MRTVGVERSAARIIARVLLLGLAVFALHGPHAAAAPASCEGAPIEPDRVVTGEFGQELQGSHVLIPFHVDDRTTAVRVRYCYDQPEAPTSAAVGHTLDLGIYDARRGDELWGPAQFRGWGGSSHPDVTVSPEGFSSDAIYRRDPKAHVPGKTTRGFLPGPTPAGEWAVELGVAAVVSRGSGDADGKVAWRVEIELAGDPAFADEPYRAAPYDPTPARRGPGWYAGDFHVHGEHSSLGDATMEEVFEYAFRPLERGGAGLDFVTLSDYVTSSAWGEIGRHQASFPGKLIARSAEIVTYRGHLNNHGSATYVDHGSGPVLERHDDGRLELRRAARPASEVLETVLGAGGYTQINHPTIFPSSIPLFANFCRGCPWDYPPAATDYGKVRAIEVATGPAGLEEAPGEPGPNPFTVTAIDFWEDALARGHKIAAVGSSDSHHAGRTPNPVTQAPIGVATTVVFADELSEEGIQRGVEAGHTYVKVTGNDAPDLRLEARVPGQAGPPAIMGDTVRAERAGLVARVLGGGPRPDAETGPDAHMLLVMRDGEPVAAHPVTSDHFAVRHPASRPGRYRLQLQRGTTIVALTSPIYLDPSAPAGPAADEAAPLPLRVRPDARRVFTVRRGAFRVRCRARGGRVCSVRARLRAVRQSRERRSAARRTIGSGRCRLRGGSCTVKVRLRAAGRRALAARRGRLPVLLSYEAAGNGRRGSARRRAFLRRPGVTRRSPRFTG